MFENKLDQSMFPVPFKSCLTSIALLFSGVGKHCKQMKRVCETKVCETVVCETFLRSCCLRNGQTDKPFASRNYETILWPGEGKMARCCFSLPRVLSDCQTSKICLANLSNYQCFPNWLHRKHFQNSA